MGRFESWIRNRQIFGKYEYSPKALKLIRVATIVSVLLGNFYLIGATQNVHYFSSNPVRIHEWYEEGIDPGPYHAAVGYVEKQLKLLLGNNRISLEPMSFFPDDGIQNYSEDNGGNFGQVLGGTWSRFVDIPSIDILVDGHIDLHIIFFVGEGENALARSDYDLQIAVYTDKVRGFFNSAFVLWHEIGHALGLPHREDSIVMRTGLNLYRYTSTRDIEGPNLIAVFENGSLYDYQNSPLFWEMSDFHISWEESSDGGSYKKAFQRIYYNATTNKLYSLSRWNSTYIWGDGSAFTNESGFTEIYIPPKTMIDCWTPLEESYLDRHGIITLALWPTEHSNNSTPVISLKQGLKLITHPAWWILTLASGFVFWTSTISARDLRRMEECDDPL